jgi:hypothetical protein
MIEDKHKTEIEAKRNRNKSKNVSKEYNISASQG